MVAGAVEVGLREAVGVDEGEERDLELGTREGAADPAGVPEDAPQRGDSPPPGVPRDEVGEGGGAREAPDLRLGDRGLELLAGQDARQVEERAGGRGDGDGELAWSPRRAAARPGGCAMPGRRSLRAAVDAAAVADWRTPQSAAAARWLSTAPSPAASTAAIQRPVADRSARGRPRTHPRWSRMETPAREAVVDRALAEPSATTVSRADDAVLAASPGQRSAHRRIEADICSLYRSRCCRLDRHGPRMAASVCRITTRSRQSARGIDTTRRRPGPRHRGEQRARARDGEGAHRGRRRRRGHLPRPAARPRDGGRARRERAPARPRHP